MRTNKYHRIIKIAAKLISQKGYDGVSFQDIADKVGLHKSSIFYYFKNKEHILLGILEESIAKVSLNLAELIRNQNLEPEEKLKKAIENHLVSMVEHFDNINIYLNELRSLSMRNRALYIKKRKKYEDNYKQIIMDMQTKGYFEDLDPKMVTYGLLGMLNWVVKWYKKEGSLTMEEISHIFYKMLVK